MLVLVLLSFLFVFFRISALSVDLRLGNLFGFLSDQSRILKNSTPTKSASAKVD